MSTEPWPRYQCLDLVVKIGDEDGSLASGSATALLTGNLLDGTRIERSDTIGVVSWASLPDGRGIGVEELTEGAHRGSMDELAEWTRWADKVIAF